MKYDTQLETPARHIDSAHYHVTHKEAADLTRDCTGRAHLPGNGRERLVCHGGRHYWLARTPLQWRGGRTIKSGWVWAVYRCGWIYKDGGPVLTCEGVPCERCGRLSDKGGLS